MPPRHFDSANGMINAGWRKVGNRQRLRRKVADQFNARLAASDRRRAHCHMIYQLTKCLQNSAATLTGHRPLKPLDLGAVHRSKVGMQPGRGGITLSIRDGEPQLLLALA
jgi:hypothetical protein